MKIHLLVLPFVLFLFACSSSGVEQLHGKWIVDKEKLIAAMKAEQGPAKGIGEQMGEAIFMQLADSIFKSISVEFDTTKKEMIAKFGKEGPKVANYTVVSDSGKEIKLKIGSDSKITTITITGPDSITYREEGKDKDFPLKRAN